MGYRPGEAEGAGDGKTMSTQEGQEASGTYPNVAAAAARSVDGGVDADETAARVEKRPA